MLNNIYVEHVKKPQGCSSTSSKLCCTVLRGAGWEGDSFKNLAKVKWNFLFKFLLVPDKMAIAVKLVEIG